MHAVCRPVTTPRPGCDASSSAALSPHPSPLLPMHHCIHRASADALSKLSMEQGQEELAAQAAGPAGSAAAGALMAVDAAQAATPPAKPDSLASLLGLLASVYGMHPGACCAAA